MAVVFFELEPLQHPHKLAKLEVMKCLVVSV
jgi:hypothetical protein